MELYKKHRPATLDQVVGNVSTVKTLKNMLEKGTLPHTILFHGPSGCGKTTLARILANELDCAEVDMKEMNCSANRGIDSIREIERTMRFAATAGKVRVYICDESHQWTPDAQNAALKMLEDTPRHVYFFLCTTDPGKLKQTIRTRCCEMPVESLSNKNALALIRRVSKDEKIRLSKDVAEDIADAALGSARTCLVLLDKLSNLPKEEHQNAITEQQDKMEGIELCRALIRKAGWNTITKILKDLEGDPEGLRRNVLGYARSVLMKAPDKQAYNVLVAFEAPFYDSGAPGLMRACFEAIMVEDEDEDEDEE